MRWLVVCATGVAACAGPEKMSWPHEPAPERSPPSPVARGGPLGERPPAEIPSPKSPPVAPADPDLTPTPEDGHAYVVLRWPILATGVNSLFGVRSDPIDGSNRYHAGIDLDAAYGAVVGASAGGWVSSAEWHAGHGRRVVVEHAGGFQTVYSHLSQILAVTGTRVRAGDAIGRVGNSGRSTGPHLHFEINRWGEHLDPLDHLGVPLPIE